MIGTTILIIQIVGVFPYIEGQQWLQAALYRIGGIRLLGDGQLTIVVCRQPHPARAEQRGTLLLEFLLESLKRAEISTDSLGKLAYGLIVGLWRRELSEVELVIQNLARIVQAW